MFRMPHKKFIVIAGVVIAAGIAIYFGVSFLLSCLSLREVTFNLNRDVDSAVVYRGGYSETQPEKMAELSEPTTTVRLHDGQYLVVPSGQNVSPEPIDVTVDAGTRSVDINPNYSAEYLNNLREKDDANITDIIRGQLGSDIADGYEIAPGQLFKNGEWYGTTLLLLVNPVSFNFDQYRIIMHREATGWKILVSPRLTISYKDFPDVPKDIIDSVNRME